MRWWWVILMLAACHHARSAAIDAPTPGDAMIDSPDAPSLPATTIPCDVPAQWPLAIRSASHPVLVHYRTADEEAKAREVLGYVDHAWDVEVNTLGFRPPIDDGGRCGPDGAFDVYLWHGIDECYVDVLDENPATAWDDRVAYLVVDPWGPYGGPILDTTVAHELNHALQAADDWSDAAAVYEMTAVFVEDLVYDDDNEYVNQIVDFQAHPDWSLDRDDGYVTWYMYGAALYLRFVRDAYFAGDGSFVGEMWRRLRSPIDRDEPDFEDALDQILMARAGVHFVDSVATFARWRWYTGAHADAAHLREGATFAEPARAASLASATGGTFAASPEALGSQYVELTGAGRVQIALAQPSSAVDWVLELVPGLHGADGDRLASGTIVDLPAAGRTLVITALPHASYDPDSRPDEHHHANVVVHPM